MICLRCQNEEFRVNPGASVEQEFRGETFSVIAPVSECTQCGWQTLAPGQADELMRRTADEYRRRNGLLTGAEIRAQRERLGMSQAAFADLLKVGIASVKRWEGCGVQEPLYDERIREVSGWSIQQAVRAWRIAEWMRSRIESGGFSLEPSTERLGRVQIEWTVHVHEIAGAPLPKRVEHHDDLVPIAA